MLLRLRRAISVWLAYRERTVRRRLEGLKSERDSLFQTFEVARQDVAFERSDSADMGTREADLRNLDRASEHVRNRIRRTERRMARLRRSADRCHDLSRALIAPHRD